MTSPIPWFHLRINANAGLSRGENQNFKAVTPP
jgi:hypothetical protein